MGRWRRDTADPKGVQSAPGIGGPRLASASPPRPPPAQAGPAWGTPGPCTRTPTWQGLAHWVPGAWQDSAQRVGRGRPPGRGQNRVAALRAETTGGFPFLYTFHCLPACPQCGGDTQLEPNKTTKTGGRRPRGQRAGLGSHRGVAPPSLTSAARSEPWGGAQTRGFRAARSASAVFVTHCHCGFKLFSAAAASVLTAATTFQALATGQAQRSVFPGVLVSSHSRREGCPGQFRTSLKWRARVQTLLGWC